MFIFYTFLKKIVFSCYNSTNGGLIVFSSPIIWLFSVHLYFIVLKFFNGLIVLSSLILHCFQFTYILIVLSPLTFWLFSFLWWIDWSQVTLIFSLFSVHKYFYCSQSTDGLIVDRSLIFWSHFSDGLIVLSFLMFSGCKRWVAFLPGVYCLYFSFNLYFNDTHTHANHINYFPHTAWWPKKHLNILGHQLVGGISDVLGCVYLCCMYVCAGWLVPFTFFVLFTFYPFIVTITSKLLQFFHYRSSFSPFIFYFCFLHLL